MLDNNRSSVKMCGIKLTESFMKVVILKLIGQDNVLAATFCTSSLIFAEWSQCTYVPSSWQSDRLMNLVYVL